MTVPGLSIFFIVCNMLLGILIPVALGVFFRKKYGASWAAFGIGAGMMFIFALVLEQLVHTVVLTSPVGAVIQGNIWLYALYGGLMAGLFEETARFVAMRFLLQKQQDNDYNALMYGAGHGGFEACYILVFGMINNLIYALLLNSGNAELLLQGVDAGGQAAVQQAFAALANTPSWLFLMSPIERGAAVLAQLSLSVLVWFAAKGNIKWYPIAVLLHALLDIAAVVLNATLVSVILVEAAVWMIAVCYVLLAKKIWKKESKHESAREL